MEASLTGMWVNFFTAAGIPSDVGATYALTFTDNRIQTDMLLELNKEYLRDMGITRMGDVIAILRHAKLVHENAARDRVLNTASPKVPIAAVTGRLTATQAKPSSPASRMLEHYTRNPQPAELPQVSSKITIKRRITDASRGTTDDVKKVRHIEINTGEAVRPAAAPAAKQTVFSRLGGAPETVGEVVSKAADVKTIFSRLGNKSLTVNFGENKRSVQHEERGEPLQYEGILKSQTELKKVVINTVKPTPVRKSVTVGTMRADEAPISVKQKLAISKSKSVKFSNHIDYKEIEPIPKKRVFFESVSTAAIKIREAENPVFNKPERRLMKPTPINNPDVKARLGAKPEAQVIQRNVFNRLGGGNP